MNSLVGRKIAMWRCVIDPMVGPKPRNAFTPENMGMEARYLNEGIYVKVLPHGTFEGTEHVIPFANISSIRLDKEVIENDSHRGVKK